jgi:hypothetical protein
MQNDIKKIRKELVGETVDFFCIWGALMECVFTTTNNKKVSIIHPHSIDIKVFGDINTTLLYSPILEIRYAYFDKVHSYFFKTANGKVTIQYV